MGVGAYGRGVAASPHTMTVTSGTGAGDNNKVATDSIRRRRPPQPWEAVRRRNQMQTLGNINRQERIKRQAKEKAQ
jgi:hypothetical protein